MDEQERQVIEGIFQRLRQVENQPRDPEAERFIADKVRQQPYAPYAMAQAVVVQEQALANLDAEVQRLRQEVERLQRQPASGGLLGALFGGSRSPEPARPGQGSPWGRPQGAPGSGMPPQGRGMPYQGHGTPYQGQGMPPQGMGGPWGQRGGGGFLQSAMATAAGVAGGMMIANALSHAFGGNEPGAGDAAGLAGFGNEAGAADGGAGGITDSLYQDASLDQGDAGDPGDYGGDGGDSGDWA